MHWPPRKGDEHRTQACGAGDLAGGVQRRLRIGGEQPAEAVGRPFSALLVNSISYAANDPSSEIEFFLDFGPGPPGFSLQSSQMF